MDDISEIREIWRGEVGRALKSGRVTALLVLFMLFTGLALTAAGIANYIATKKEEAMLKDKQVDKEQIIKADAEQRKAIVGWFFSSDDELTEALAEMPLLLFLVFKLSTIFLPLFIALMGFDQISGEIGPKSIRFLVLRVRRSSIVMGKFLSQATLLTGLMAISTLVTVIVAKALNPDFTFGHATLIFGKLLLAGVVSVLAYEALTSLCSALTRQAGVSLLLNVGVMFVIWFISMVSSAFRAPGADISFGSLQQLLPESYLAYLKYISVWTYNQDLLHPSAVRFFSAVMVHLGYGLVFLGLAHLVLRKRDI